MTPTVASPPVPLDGAGASLPETGVLDPEGVDVVSESLTASAMTLMNSYAHILVIAFVVTLLATPLIRRLAIYANVIDRPDVVRKTHSYPVAYLGGLAVFFGIVTAIAASYVTTGAVPLHYRSVPIAIVIGMMAITFTGLADDLWGWDPRLKIAGQLVAAAALALERVGVQVAEGVFIPFLGEPDNVLLAIGSFQILNEHLYYWTGTALIAVFVLGGCNSANLIDGLDGLLSGVVAIVAVGLLAISLLMAPEVSPKALVGSDGTLAGARIVLSLALLGATLGFLPHNFNPAAIFLGDCGSLLLGYMAVVIILMLGEQGQTHLVFAGLIVFSLPIIDTTLAIIRRWLAGVSLSAADDQHIHHQLKRGLGGVKQAVFALYGITALFAAVGVTLAALVMRTELRVRVVYAVALILFSFIGVIAVKAARRQQILAAVSPKPSPAKATAAGKDDDVSKDDGQSPPSVAKSA